MKELQITALKDGVVIDHIPSKQAFKIVELLSLKDYDGVVTVAFNLTSKSLQKKGLIKIAERCLDEEELAKIATLAPHATVNFIENYEVKKKLHLEMPEVIDDIIKCGNTKCISNHEQIPSKFLLMNSEQLSVKCFFCERVMHEEEITTK